MKLKDLQIKKIKPTENKQSFANALHNLPILQDNSQFIQELTCTRIRIFLEKYPQYQNYFTDYLDLTLS